MNSKQIFTAAAAAVLVLTSLPVAAQGNWQPGDFGALRVRLGVFEPDGESTFWDEKHADWTGDASELEDVCFGIDYLWTTSRNAGVLFGFAHFDGDATHAYRGWFDGNGNPVRHTSQLDIDEITAAYMLRFGSRNGRVLPYLGAGVGYAWWSFEETGYFIDDFDSSDPEVFRTSFYASGDTWQAFAFAGLELPMSDYWSFLGEARWKKMDDEMNKDFAGFGTIDLGGVEVSVGVIWNF